MDGPGFSSGKMPSAARRCSYLGTGSPSIACALLNGFHNEGLHMARVFVKIECRIIDEMLNNRMLDD